MTSEPTASAIVVTEPADPCDRATRTASETAMRVRAQVERHAHRRHAVGEQLDQPAGHPGRVTAVGHLVVADRFRPFDVDARAVGQHAVERLQRQTGQVSRSIGQVTMRTSSKPRCSAASARLRASPECPQITGSARTTMTSRRRCVLFREVLFLAAVMIELPVV